MTSLFFIIIIIIFDIFLGIIISFFLKKNNKCHVVIIKIKIHRKNNNMNDLITSSLHNVYWKIESRA